MTDDPGSWPRARPLTPEELRRAYANGGRIMRIEAVDRNRQTIHNDCHEKPPTVVKTVSGLNSNQPEGWARYATTAPWQDSCRIAAQPRSRRLLP